jgi:putative ABC transport system substrate-binding protein
MRRIGVLMNVAADDPESTVRVAAFVQGLAELGWTVGSNVRIDYRWGAGDADSFRKYAAELIALVPDVILAHGVVSVGPLQQATRTVPIVFVNVSDPVGAGLVESLARPGGNATGFILFEYGISPKWLELLKEIERAVAAFARGPNGGLIVVSGTSAGVNRKTIFALVARHRLPAVYPFRYFVTGGGLISYGPDQVDQYRRAAGYVDRILKGEKPADLPVQTPTKYELVINLKTAKALGLEISPMRLARADEVIE